MCPICSGSMTPVGGSLRCTDRHSFDIARQGYVSLLTGRGSAHRSDTAEMVAARNRVFDAGLYAPIVDGVAAHCRDSGRVVDAGSGPGHYLAAALDAAGDAALGVGVDLSRYCARSAARRHPRGMAVVADLWAGMPIGDGRADTVLSVFAPRNVAETARTLAPGGRWIIVTPMPDHLAEIVEPMHMLSVGEDKDARLAQDLTADFTVVSSEELVATAVLDEAMLVDVAAMGPAAFHRSPEELAAAAAALAAGGTVAASLRVRITCAVRR